MMSYAILQPSGARVRLIAGMRWHTVVGRDLAARARQRARETRASHYAHAAPGADTMGTVRLARADRGRAGAPLHGAALAFAGLHPHGAAALCATLPDGRVWLAAAQGGAVLAHTDRIHAAAGDARAALRELLERHGGGLALYGDACGEPAAPFDLELLATGLGAGSALRPAGWRLPLPPRPLALAGAAALLAFGLRAGWDWRRPAAVPPPAAESVDAELAWRQAWAGFAAQTTVQSQASFERLLAALAALPPSVAGWGLRSVACEPAAGGGWVCGAAYRRVRHGATSAGFLAAAPEGWRTSWRPLDDATASFRVDAQAPALDPAALETLAWHEARTMSALQRMLPAFAAIAVGQAVPVRIAPPRDPAGTPLPAAAGGGISEQSIALEGPLRSFGLIPEATAGHVAWKSVELRVDAAAPSSLNRSRLMAAATGVLYAKN
ncbi:type 4b pilus protein PilO2 [Pigmentiphaga soli]|uniref:Type 4b pilus protein PilO2 n=1 Tax=Pigmentiphaga soli TaxID=1007095 RepID=A0ABP8GEK5_9BURK